MSSLLVCLSAHLTSPGDVGKILGEKWKELTEKERKPYDEKARVDKERYETEKARYQSVSGSASASPPPG